MHTPTAMLVVASLALLSPISSASQRRERRNGRVVSPVRGVDGHHTDGRGERGAPAGFPSLDGSGNHESDVEMGAAGTALARLVTPAYADGVSALAGEARPDPRTISNTVLAQDTSLPNTLGVSDFLWQ